MFASSRQAKRRRGPGPRADHWCVIVPEWRTAPPLRKGRQKSVKSTRHRIHVAAAYDLSYVLRTSACGVLKYSVKSRPRSEVEVQYGPLISNELGSDSGEGFGSFLFLFFIFKSQFGKCMRSRISAIQRCSRGGTTAVRPTLPNRSCCRKPTHA